MKREMRKGAALLKPGHGNRKLPGWPFAGIKTIIARSPEPERYPAWLTRILGKSPCCGPGYARPDCVTLRRPPRRSVKYASGGFINGRKPCQYSVFDPSLRKLMQYAGLSPSRLSWSHFLAGVCLQLRSSLPAVSKCRLEITGRIEGYSIILVVMKNRISLVSLSLVLFLKRLPITGRFPNPGTLFSLSLVDST